MNELITYIQTARNNGLSDAEIKQRLIEVGWDAHEVYRAIETNPELVPPLPQASKGAMPTRQDKSELSVVSGGFSAKGFEYFIFFIALGGVALAIGALMHNVVNSLLQTDKYSFYANTIPVATASLIVLLPIFIYLLLRLRKAELANPEIKKDQTRRRGVQFLMLVTFLVGILKLTAYLYNIISPDTSVYSSTNVIAETVHALITIGVSGAIFGYYWREQASIDK